MAGLAVIPKTTIEISTTRVRSPRRVGGMKFTWFTAWER